MTDYDVHRYAELADAVRDGASPLDTMHILGAVAVPQSTPELSYRVERGGTLVIASSCESSAHVAGGVLRIIYDQHLALTLYGTDTPGGVVELVNFPSGDADAVARVGAPYRWEIVHEGDGVEDAVSPSHYTWIGRALSQSGAPERTVCLQSWDLLDALFPNNPHLWNAGKYLTRYGRKGDSSKRVEDLRKAVAYLERAIKAEERNAS